MAGLCAAARARELGATVTVYEKGDRAGGSMLLSSCVVWRHRDFDEFRAECPRGDPTLQRLLYDHLDDALAWLERLGAPVVARETGNSRTTGIRFEPRGLTALLAERAGDIALRTPVPPLAPRPLLLATGGFAAELARRRGLLLRANPWSEGDGLALGRSLGADTWGDLDEFYGRALPAAPARVPEEAYVAAAQLYGRFALVVDDAGSPVADGPVSWSETDLVQAIAARAGGRAWYVTDSRARAERIRERTVDDMVATAERLGGVVHRGATLEELTRLIGVPRLQRSNGLLEPPFVAVRVAAAVTHTVGGLRVDSRARVLDTARVPIPGLYAAGADVGGLANGGYASGLAGALVLGLTAAESAFASR